jgi:hypothetical protein
MPLATIAQVRTSQGGSPSGPFACRDISCGNPSNVATDALPDFSAPAYAIGNFFDTLFALSDACAMGDCASCGQFAVHLFRNGIFPMGSLGNPLATRAAPIAGKVEGFTVHGLDQAITHGVKPGSILDAAPH